MRHSSLSHEKKRIKMPLFMAGCFIFLLLLARGFPVTCDDWFLIPPHPFIGFYDAYYRGFTWAQATAICFNGRYLGNFLAGFVASSELLRHVLICLGITGIVALLCRMCGVRSFTGFLLTATLVIALPAPMFAQTYAWSAGYFNYVPPALCVLGYISIIFPLFQGKKIPPWTAVPVFFLGLCSQLFVENVTIGLCILSLGTALAFRKIKKRFSPILLGHLLGTIIGCVLMFMAEGYGAIGTENDAYRSMGGGLMGTVLLAAENLTKITDQMTGNNWLVILPLSSLCLKLWRMRAGGKKPIAYLSILLPTVFFFVNHLWLIPLREREALVYPLCALALLLNGVYLLAVCRTFFVCVEQSQVRWNLLYLFGSSFVFLAPLLVVSPVSERCLYLSHILWICVLLHLLDYAMGTSISNEKLKKGVVISICVLLLFGYQWMMQQNGTAEAYRIALTKAAMDRGETHIELPGYPYEAFVHGEESPAIEEFYYYNTSGDITFTLVDYEDWDFSADQAK